MLELGISILVELDGGRTPISLALDLISQLDARSPLRLNRYSFEVEP